MTGEPTRMARVSGVRARMSAFRRVSRTHCRTGPIDPVAPGSGGAPPPGPAAAAVFDWRPSANRWPHDCGVPSPRAARRSPRCRRPRSRRTPPRAARRTPRRPSSARTAILSQRSASSGLCVVSTTVVPSLASPRSTRISSAPRAGSRPDVGSSRKNSAGPASSSDRDLGPLALAAGQLPDRHQRTAGRAPSASAAPSTAAAGRRAAARRRSGACAASGRSRWMMSSCGT